jgi:hypothetical protein
MNPIRSENRQRGLSVVELLIYIMLSLVIMLAAGTVFTGVYHSFRTGAHKLVAQREASLLATTISRRVRIASNFVIYNVPNRAAPADSGNGLALLDLDGDVTYRLEWDATNLTLADSTGARVTAMRLQNLQFRTDPVSPRVVHYEFQTDDEIGNLVDIESAASLRN